MNVEIELENYKKRKEENKGRQIKNSSLPLDAAFYFYCTHCGVCTDVVPPDFMGVPVLTCPGCKGLIEKGFLN